MTAGSRPVTILLADGTQRELPVSPLEGPLEDLGAGDVFAAAFFILLARGARVEAAAAFASAAAAVRMRGGGPAAIGDRAAVEARMLDAARGAQRLSAASSRRASFSAGSVSWRPHARAASSRLPPTGAIATGTTSASGASLVDRARERHDEHLARLVRAADQADGKRARQAGLADHGGDLHAELAAPRS